MVGFCMKDNGEEHYEIVHHNLSVGDMNEGKMEYVKFMKVDLNICVSLSHSNILQITHQWSWFCMKKYWVLLLQEDSFTCARVGNSTPI